VTHFSQGFLLQALSCFFAMVVCASVPARDPVTTVTLFEPSGRVLGPGQVRTGLDVLREQRFAPLIGKRLGVLTHRAAIDRDGNHLLDLMRRVPGMKVVSVFAPEHGLYGDLDTHIDDFVEPQTGLKVHSLYTTKMEGRKARGYPRNRDLEGLDAVVIDMQDIGARFYTYSSLMGKMMEACAEVGVEVVVIDRPNPIGGLQVDGPLPDPDQVGVLTSYHPLPLMHGMTMGEIARLYKGELDMDLRLTVIEMEGWTRDLYFDQTGLRWLDPSPNIRTLDAALAYPGSAMVESLVSMGRGTEEPFAQLGAPWIENPEGLRDYLTTTAIAGLKLEVADFTPTGTLARNHVGEGRRCLGVRYTITDRDAFRPVVFGVYLMHWLHENHSTTLVPERRWSAQTGRREPTGRVVPVFHALATRGLNASWIAGALNDRKTPEAILKTIEREVTAFRKIREKYLIYK
jgi:uncharacterized protein YbbC (DUF1343 family)